MPFLYDWVFFLLQIVGHWWKLTLWLNSNNLPCECKALSVVVVRLVQAGSSAPCQRPHLQEKRLDFSLHHSDLVPPSVCPATGAVPSPPTSHESTVITPSPSQHSKELLGPPLPFHEGAPRRVKLHRERWFWFYWKYKTLYKNPVCLSVSSLGIWLRLCTCEWVYLCVCMCLCV